MLAEIITVITIGDWVNIVLVAAAILLGIGSVLYICAADLIFRVQMYFINRRKRK